MSPDASIPSAPVYAARLNGLLKVLANAEGAVSQCVKARRTMVEELQKILETNTTALAAEEQQLATVQQRKTEVDDKKREVEISIMQGLSNDDPVPSGSPNGQPETGADHPEVEALTPPALEPEYPVVDEEVGAPPHAEETTGAQMETLNELVSHHRSISTGTNGSSKKRKLANTDDFPDLGKDDVIDDDVAEMLRNDGGASS